MWSLSLSISRTSPLITRKSIYRGGDYPSEKLFDTIQARIFLRTLANLDILGGQASYDRSFLTRCYDMFFPRILTAIEWRKYRLSSTFNLSCDLFSVGKLEVFKKENKRMTEDDVRMEKNLKYEDKMF